MDVQLNKKYSANGVMRSLDIYNFPDYYSHPKRCLSYRYLLQYIDIYRLGYRKCPKIAQIEDNINIFFNSLMLNIDKNKNTLLELMDIMVEHNSVKGGEMLNTIRQQEADLKERKRRQEIIRQQRELMVLERGRLQVIRRDRILRLRDDVKVNLQNKTVYEDSQNVHNSKINKSVKKCAIYIHKLALERGPLPTFKYIKNRIEGLFGPCDKVFNRIHTDNATYGISLTLENIFISICVWIFNHKSQDELLMRLWQEFKEMEGYCSTGHLSRLVNIIQGFSDDNNLEIRISEKEQYKARIHTYLNKILENNEKMAEEMMNKTEIFKNFIKSKISEKIDEEKWDNETNEINEIVNYYTQMDIYKMK